MTSLLLTAATTALLASTVRGQSNNGIYSGVVYGDAGGSDTVEYIRQRLPYRNGTEYPLQYTGFNWTDPVDNNGLWTVSKYHSRPRNRTHVTMGSEELTILFRMEHSRQLATRQSFHSESRSHILRSAMVRSRDIFESLDQNQQRHGCPSCSWCAADSTKHVLRLHGPRLRFSG